MKIEVGSADLLDLLVGTLVAVDLAKDADQATQCINLVFAEGRLTATATDRYRLITGSLAVEGSDLSVMVHSSDVKQIITLLKEAIKTSHIPLATLELLEDGRLAVVAGLRTFQAVPEVGHTFPPFEHLFAIPSQAQAEAHFNPLFMWDFNKVPHDEKGSYKLAKPRVSFVFKGEGKPAEVKIPHHSISWRALLMPMRVAT